MRKFLLILPIAGLIYLAACAGSSAGPPLAANLPLPASNAVQTEAKSVEDDAPRISLADAKKDYDSGSVIIVDVRAESAYKEEHIKSSLNISIDTLTANLNKFPKGKKIIAYCS